MAYIYTRGTKGDKMGDNNFKRQESWKRKKIENSWRRPRGKHSKQRLEKKGKLKVPKIGYKKPEEERGKHPSGYEEKLVTNKENLENIDPDQTAVRIRGSVGTRKREKIKEKAKELGLKVLN